MYNKSDYACIRSLIVRSPAGSSPVDFNVNLNIEAKDYDKVMIQLLSVNIDQNNSGSFPYDSTNEINSKSFSVECSLGQIIFDTNGKRSYLGTVNINRELKRAVHYDGITQPLIELSSVPNGQYNFQLKDKDGVVPTIDDGTDVSIQGITYVFQLYLMKNEIKTKQMNL